MEVAATAVRVDLLRTFRNFEVGVDPKFPNLFLNSYIKLASPSLFQSFGLYFHEQRISNGLPAVGNTIMHCAYWSR